MRAEMRTPYKHVAETVLKFGWELPPRLVEKNMHLDPDFGHLTYGDVRRRGKRIADLIQEDDLLVFYAGLRDIHPSPRLVYALIGLYVVDAVVPANQVATSVWSHNAHTRRMNPGTVQEIVVRAKEGISGRLDRCIPIGSFRTPASEPRKRPCYRVDGKVLSEWGGLSVKDGYLQRSAYLPEFLEPERFLRWFKAQGRRLIARNN